ncbi:MAG: NifB/NifX family molybdenum-iron cluster-binding protein [Theionarchaea archaeon]|nr:NifB/NifX family molybdenum-iron cluster-binding protein [Theionarchaea archaeon]MBU7038740.1 NifB/NifX family molybdenum-iron cluster-binding protein [Theionarchaea archaeon]
MKIAISATDQTLEAAVDPRFGRCRYFLIVDTDTMDFHTVPNLGERAGKGAGVQASQIVSNEEVDAVIGNNFGPNAFSALKYAGMKIYNGSGVISDVITQFKNAELPELSESNVPKGSGQSSG